MKNHKLSQLLSFDDFADLELLKNFLKNLPEIDYLHSINDLAVLSEEALQSEESFKKLKQIFLNFIDYHEETVRKGILLTNDKEILELQNERIIEENFEVSENNRVLVEKTSNLHDQMEEIHNENIQIRQMNQNLLEKIQFLEAKKTNTKKKKQKIKETIQKIEIIHKSELEPVKRSNVDFLNHLKEEIDSLNNKVIVLQEKNLQQSHKNNALTSTMQNLEEKNTELQKNKLKMDNELKKMKLTQEKIYSGIRNQFLHQPKPDFKKQLRTKSTDSRIIDRKVAKKRDLEKPMKTESTKETMIDDENVSFIKETKRRLGFSQTFTHSLRTDIEKSFFTSSGQIFGDEVINPNFPYNCNVSISHIQITPNNSIAPMEKEKKIGFWDCPKKIVKRLYGNMACFFRTNVHLSFIAVLLVVHILRRSQGKKQ